MFVPLFLSQRVKFFNSVFISLPETSNLIHEDSFLPSISYFISFGLCGTGCVVLCVSAITVLCDRDLFVARAPDGVYYAYILVGVKIATGVLIYGLLETRCPFQSDDLSRCPLPHDISIHSLLHATEVSTFYYNNFL